jgi:hypothetical protein
MDGIHLGAGFGDTVGESWALTRNRIAPEMYVYGALYFSSSIKA